MTKESLSKTITISEVLAAIKKNGKQFTKRSFFKSKEGYRYGIATSRFSYKKKDIVAACAIGQAALNLSVHPVALQEALGVYANRIIDINDDPFTKSFDDVVEKFEKLFPEAGAVKITVDNTIKNNTGKDWIEFEKSL